MSEKIIHLTVGPLATNCWIYPIKTRANSDESPAVIVDPGDEPDLIISVLKKNNLYPAYILLTHGHFDHIAAMPFLKTTFGGKPQIAIHRLDADYIGENAYEIQAKSIKAATGITAFLDMLWPKQEVPQADILLEEGDKIDDLFVLHLPGHSQGSIAIWDKEERVLFSGDTLFEGNYGRTDLPGGSEKDIFKSLQRLFELDPDITVYPGHGGTTTIGREAKNFR